MNDDRHTTLIGSLFVVILSLSACSKTDSLPNQDGPEPTLVEQVSVKGFDAEGEPVIKKWSDGSIWIHFEAMPPFFAEDNGTEAEFENFESKIQDVLGVPIHREDREVFIITHPKPDTVERAKAWLEGYRNKRT